MPPPQTLNDLCQNSFGSFSHVLIADVCALRSSEYGASFRTVDISQQVKPAHERVAFGKRWRVEACPTEGFGARDADVGVELSGRDGMNSILRLVEVRSAGFADLRSLSLGPEQRRLRCRAAPVSGGAAAS
jgi:hypothetical protein